MNKFPTTLVCLCFAISTLSAQTYSGGSGTEADPYLISTKADREALATATNTNSSYSTGKYFLLTQDITDTIIGNSSSYPAPVDVRFYLAPASGGFHLALWIE